MDYSTGICAFILTYLCLGKLVKCDKEEICSAEQFEGRCPADNVIIMESALYGRMRLSPCIASETGIGCENDVLHLADIWCSGRQECVIAVPNMQLKAANIQCSKDLMPYMEVEYYCVKIASPNTDVCSSSIHLDVPGKEGYVSSHVTAQTGCGSVSAPWVIEVPPGQTIDMSLLDFGALGRYKSTLGLGCQKNLGYIVERNLGSNFTICGNHEREKHIYTSKTNKVELSLVANGNERERQEFIVKYSVIGCSDLTPPAHAWYKREGSEAVIGCKSNDRVWRLYCNGNTWDGVVGNCSISKENRGGPNVGIKLQFSSVIFLTGVVCGAILLIIVVVVAGTVYVKKQSIRHEIKLRSDYACTTLSSTQYFPTKIPGYSATLGRSGHGHHIEDNQPLVQISDKTFSTVVKTSNMAPPENCACATVARNPGVRDP